MSQCHTLVESVTSVVVQRTDCDRAPVIAPVSRTDVVLETPKPTSVVTFGGIPGRQGPEGPPGPAGAGDMEASVYDPQEIEADAFDRSNHTGTQPLATISDAGTAASQDIGDFATAAQGAKADTAYGWGNHADANYLTQHQSLAGYATETWVGNQGYLTQHQDISGKADKFTNTSTGTNKTLADRERCTVTAAGRTITLPASPAAGAIVVILVGDFDDTVIARNGSTIMGLSEDLTIDVKNVAVTLVYNGTTWRIV